MSLISPITNLSRPPGPTSQPGTELFGPTGAQTAAGWLARELCNESTTTYTGLGYG